MIEVMMIENNESIVEMLIVVFSRQSQYVDINRES